MLTWHANQWPADTLRVGFDATIQFETERRKMLNHEMTAGYRYSVRPDSVCRDVLRNFLAAVLPAGVA